MRFMAMLCAIVGLLALSEPATAQSCSASNLQFAFGAVDTLAGQPVDSFDQVVVDCDGLGPEVETVTVCLVFGVVAPAMTRQGGSETLSFGAFTDSQRSVTWDNQTPIRLALPAANGTATGDATVYVRIPGGQSTAPAGVYDVLYASGASWIAATGDLSCEGLSGGTSGTFDVSASAQIEHNCLIVANDLDFGSAGLITSPIDAATDLDVTCTPGTGYAITMGPGLHNDGQRRMNSGSDYVVYELYKDFDRGQVWGSISGVGDGTTDQIPVYGRVPAPQSPAVGSYSDTVVVTISYEE
jgi:spore coat protein U-like protein